MARFNITWNILYQETIIVQEILHIMAWINVERDIQGDILILKINLTKRIRRSNEDRSTIIAETAGNEPIPCTNNLKISLFVYEPD